MPPSNPEAVLVLHLRAYGLPEGEAEFRFHPSRRWRFDRAWRERLLAVEIEGGLQKRPCAPCKSTGVRRWVNGVPQPCRSCDGQGRSVGRHTRGDGYEADLEKYNSATLLGWRVLRFSTRQVHQGHAIDVLRGVFDAQPRS